MKIKKIKKSRVSTKPKEFKKINEKMFLLYDNNIPEPNEDMPDTIKDNYYEAKKILNLYPEKSYKLLKLTLNDLLIFIGINGIDLNERIKNYSTQKKSDKDMVEILKNIPIFSEKTIDKKQEEFSDFDKALKLYHILNFITYEEFTKKKNKDLILNLPQKQK